MILAKIALIAILAAGTATAAASVEPGPRQAAATVSPQVMGAGESLNLAFGADGWAEIDTRQFPNGRVRYEALGVEGEVVQSGFFTVENSILTQVASTGDPYVIRAVYDGALITEIYENQSTLEIEYREIDVATDTVTLVRPAMPIEAADYTAARAQAVADNAKAAALASLQSNPEGGSSPYAQWVTNHVAELQACQDDMATAQTFDFNALGPNTQNDVIRRSQECDELYARVLKQLLPNLHETLLAGGLIVATE